MGFLLANWETLVMVVGPLLGLLGGYAWKGREATRVEVEKWANVAADFVITLLARGVIPAEEGAIIDVWFKRFQYLLSLVGLRVTGKNLEKAKALALARVGSYTMDKELAKLGNDAGKLGEFVDEVLKRLPSTPNRRKEDAK